MSASIASADLWLFPQGTRLESHEILSVLGTGTRSQVDHVATRGSTFAASRCRMTRERWQQVEQLYHAARTRAAGERASYLDAACAGDAGLRREVESLLARQSSGTGGQLDDPARAGRASLPDEPSVSRLAPGAQLGPYQIDSLLGSGGMGQVYKAFDARLGRDVAIKVAAERFSERFDREVRAVASLNHPNICTVYDVGPNYLVMELVDGKTLREWFRGALPLERGLGIARQVLEALGTAHRAGVVHRDLKPENVMVRTDGYVKVLDFGLAKWLPTTAQLQAERTTMHATQPGQILGTVAYMSPEQIQGQDVDARSDLFAFGILLYEMLSGRHPWSRPSAVDTLHAILHDNPPPIDALPQGAAALAAVVETLLRKYPAERYSSAEAVLEALATSAGDRGSSMASLVRPPLLSSIAVLPFVFLSDVEGSRALSLGFADAVITILGNLEDVVVAPTSAILSYAAGTEPARVCGDLGVRHSLQGTVQKLGAHWRVSMQLFDATTQKVTLSEKHDFDLDNVFEVQDEIGRRVAESLHSRFPSTVPKSRDRYSSDPEAYSEFMAGLRESSSDEQETLRSAAEHLSGAVERDPEFALAHATLSFVSMNIHFQFDPQRTWLQRAEDHCRLALALDPMLPEGHLARAWILWSPAKNFQHAEAIAALEQVLAARPNLERAHNRMATICMHIGRLEEGRIAHEQSLRSNPRTRTGNLEYFHIYSGDFARAENASETWFRERPENMYALATRIIPALLRGNLVLAEERLAAALKSLPDEPMLVTFQGMLHARRGQTDVALECVRKALESPRSFGHTHHTYYNIACVHAVLRDTDKAMAWLERSVDTGFPCWPFFRIDPHLENLREEPAFTQLVDDLEQTYATLKIQRL
jgi:serine/threonine protein kinase/Tfp pilus assembly protein PilF